jgi:hypothetical protein
VGASESQVSHQPRVKATSFWWCQQDEVALQVKAASFRWCQQDEVVFQVKAATFQWHRQDEPTFPVNLDLLLCDELLDELTGQASPPRHEGGKSMSVAGVLSALTRFHCS